MGKRKEKRRPQSKLARRKICKMRDEQYVERHGHTLQHAANMARREKNKSRRDLAATKRSLESVQASLDSERARSREIAAAHDAVEQKCAAQAEVVEAAQARLDAAVTRVRQLEEAVGAEQQLGHRVEDDLAAKEQRREAAEERMQEQEEKMMRSEEVQVEDMKQQLAVLRTRHEQLVKQEAKLESELGIYLWDKNVDDEQRLKNETLPLRCQVDLEQMNINDREREIKLLTEMSTKFKKKKGRTTDKDSVLRQVSRRIDLLRSVQYVIFAAQGWGEEELTVPLSLTVSVVM